VTNTPQLLQHRFAQPPIAVGIDLQECRVTGDESLLSSFETQLLPYLRRCYVAAYVDHSHGPVVTPAT
jgi:hypothetical protein